jgi:formate hydrogenlyase subunit 6/NADH:ubiquinone oxidoreductase subunit I
MSMTGEVYKHLFRKRATILYPFKERELIPIPKGLRGKLAFDLEKCVGCGMCFRVCPSETIEMIDDETKKRLKRPIFRLDRCTFCAQCEDVCPTHAILMTNNFELAGFDRRQMLLK